jgi:hypothetical protein
MDVLLYKMAGMVQNWMILCTAEKKVVETDIQWRSGIWQKQFCGFRTEENGNEVRRVSVPDQHGRSGAPQLQGGKVCNLANSVRLM